MNAESICQDTRVARRSQLEGLSYLRFSAGIALDIDTTEIKPHLVKVLSYSNCYMFRASEKNPVFVGNTKQQSFEIYPHAVLE